VPADEPRDWNATLRRVLAPFRSEDAAFRVLLAVLVLAAAIAAVVLLVRALT
jgi:hypothetical protein